MATCTKIKATFRRLAFDNSERSDERVFFFYSNAETVALAASRVNDFQAHASILVCRLEPDLVEDSIEFEVVGMERLPEGMIVL